MRIVFDLDGTIAEGLHVQRPENPMQAYMALEPHGPDTADVFNELCRRHIVTILTSRHHEGDMIREISSWLDLNRMMLPHNIIAHVRPGDKGAVARALRADHFVDDHVDAVVSALAANVPGVHLMDNSGWALNQRFDAGHRRVRSWTELRERLS